jgi:uridine nucleosidase
LNHECILLQIYGDPDAADIVFTSGADIIVIGINITTQVCLTGLFIYVLTCTVQGLTINSSIADEDLLDLKNSKGKHTQFLSDMCKFYRDWHAESDGFHGI